MSHRLPPLPPSRVQARARGASSRDRHGGLFAPERMDRTEALLRWVRLQLMRRARVQGLARGQEQPWAAGLPLAEAEAIGILAATELGGAPGAAEDAALSELSAAITAAAQEAWPATPEGPLHPVDALTRQFELSRAEQQILALALALEIDAGVGEALARLQDEASPARPRVHIALQLAATRQEREELRRAFAPEGTLRSLRLILLDPVAGGMEASLTYRRFKLAERVLEALGGDDAPDPRLRAAACAPVPDSFEPTAGVAEVVQRAATLTEAEQPRLLVLHGPEGIGRRSAAVAGMRQRGPVLQHDLAVPLPDLPELAERLTLLRRESLLGGAGLLLDHLEALDSEGEAALLAACAAHPLPVVVTTLDALRGSTAPSADLEVIILSPPSLAERTQLWEAALEGVPLAPRVDLEELASRFTVGAGLIRQAAAAVRWEVERSGEPAGVEVLGRACWRLLQHGLGDLAQRVATPLGWNDLVVPDELHERLAELVRTIRYQDLVMSKWGFARKLGGRRGVSALFSGPPGTGKTLCARIVAHELGRELYRIDLSQVVSKYIGETEKNLGRVFDEARRSQSIILFDEADALFSNRTDVKSSVDRYSNMEVNFLLQRIEDFEGISVLTTNFPRSIDEAFQRRLSFRITFPFPDAEARSRLWALLLPPEMPRGDDLDFDWLGDRYEMAGGNIRNAVLRSAFLVAEEQRPLLMEDLCRAADLEYEEMGKLVGS